MPAADAPEHDPGQGQHVIFIYLRDGQRLDIEEAVTFAHRGGTVVCLDRDGQEVKRFQAADVTAYGHSAFPYDQEFISRPLAPEEKEPTGAHHRRRRRSLWTSRQASSR